MKNEITNKDPRIIEIVDLIIAGIESWRSAGEKLCILIDEQPDVIDKICAFSPGVTPNILRQLERIGRRQLVPELLLRSGPGWAQLRSMPYDVQLKYTSEPVEVLIETANGSVDTLKIKVGELTATQARQVFDGDSGLRSFGAQRAWISSNVKQTPKRLAGQPYTIHGRFVDFSECRLSLQDLLTIAAQMRAA